MMRAGAFAHPKCTVGCDCEAKMYTSNAVTPAHTALSRRIAAESIILLKNGPDRPALPLGGAGTATSNRSRPLTVAVVGSACSARHRIDTETDWRARDYYVVGGSGHVVAREGDVLNPAGAGGGRVASRRERDRPDRRRRGGGGGRGRGDRVRRRERG